MSKMRQRPIQRLAFFGLFANKKSSVLNGNSIFVVRMANREMSQFGFYCTF